MDKLRAITYFVTAVEEGSLTRAARRLDVSPPAVQKLIDTLERELGVKLLERSTHGVRTTSSGAKYLDCCRPLLGTLADTESALRHSGQRPSGTLIVATHEQLAHHVLLPALPHFQMRYPEVQIDFRTVHGLTDADAQAAEVLLLHGWMEIDGDFVHRSLGMTRSLILATPEYWLARGIPAEPKDLVRHECLLMRNPAGILIDLWEFTRQDKRQAVNVNGWLVSNAREVVLDGVLRGLGVGRFTEVTTRALIQSGRLQAVLLDWEVQGGPPINLLYRSTTRNNPRAKAFIAFAQHLLEQTDAQGKFWAQHPPAERPAWHRRGYGRASAAVRKSD